MMKRLLFFLLFTACLHAGHAANAPVLTAESLISARDPVRLGKDLKAAGKDPRADLVGLLKHKNLAVRSKALDMLEDMAGNDFGFDPWIDPDKADEAPLRAWQAWLGKPAAAAEAAGNMQRLYAMIMTGTEKSRESACRALIARKKEALDFLTDYLATHPDLDSSTTRAIRQAQFRLQLDGEVPNPTLTAKKLAGTHRNDIIDSLEELRKKSIATLPVIHELLHHGDPLVREAAVDVFLQNGAKAAVAYMAPLLEQERDENVLQIAFRRAADCDGVALAPLMVKHASSESEELCLAALKALEEMKGSNGKGEVIIPPDVLLKLLRHPEWRVRNQTLLCALKNKSIKAPLEGTFGALKQTALKTGIMQVSPDDELYQRLLEMLKDDDASVRMSAFRVVASLGSVKTLEPVLERLLFEMPDMAPIVLYAMMANQVNLSPAVQELVKRLPAEKVTVLIRQEEKWENVMTASEPNATARLVLNCLQANPSPDVQMMLAEMQAARLVETTPATVWENVLSSLENPSLPLAVKERMLDRLSLSYGDLNKICKLAIHGNMSLQPKPYQEMAPDDMPKLESLKPFGTRLVTVLRDCASRKGAENEALRTQALEHLLHVADPVALETCQKEFASWPLKMRKKIADALVDDDDGVVLQLPVIRMLAVDPDQDVRDEIKEWFQHLCNHYRNFDTEYDEKTSSHKIKIPVDARLNADVRKLLDDLFAMGDAGETLWTQFMEKYLDTGNSLYSYLRPNQYSKIFLREYVRGIVENPASSAWKRASGAFAMWCKEYPHCPALPEGIDHETLKSLYGFSHKVDGLTKWVEQWKASPNADIRRNVAGILLPLDDMKFTIRSENGAVLNSTLQGMDDFLSKQDTIAPVCPATALEAMNELARDADPFVRASANLSIWTVTQRSDTDGLLAALKEISGKDDELKKKEIYDNEYDTFLSWTRIVCEALIEPKGWSRSMFVSRLREDGKPYPGAFSKQELAALKSSFKEVLKNHYFFYSFGNDDEKTDSQIPVSFASMRDVKGPELQASDAAAPTEQSGMQPVGPPNPDAPVLVVFFEKPGCGECAKMRRLLEGMRSSFPRMNVETCSITERRGTELNAVLSSRFGIPSKDRLIAPAVFAAAGGLMRDRLTEDNLKRLLEHSSGMKECGIGPDGKRPEWATVQEQEMQQAAQEIHDMYTDLSLGVVLLGGLIDGVNPCAFATLIFFLSYLQIARRSPRELLLTGASFVLSVYLTYFAIGLAFHEMVGMLQSWGALKMVMDVLFSLLALLAAVLSFRDAWLARRGRLADMSLTLPEFLKKRIRQTTREQSKSTRFILAAFVAGIIISALELACTGQVYAPIIYQISQGSASAVGMLALYNLAFILPLLLVFILAWRGMKAEALIRYQQNHAVLVKSLLGLLFLALAAIIVWGAWR